MFSLTKTQVYYNILKNSLDFYREDCVVCSCIYISHNNSAQLHSIEEHSQLVMSNFPNRSV